jgi:hypothetical protein
MKEIWLFGGLDTLTEDQQKTDNTTEEAQRNKLEEDTRVVEAGFRRFLEKYESMINTDEVAN